MHGDIEPNNFVFRQQRRDHHPLTQCAKREGREQFSSDHVPAAMDVSAFSAVVAELLQALDQVDSAMEASHRDRSRQVRLLRGQDRCTLLPASQEQQKLPTCAC